MGNECPLSGITHPHSFPTPPQLSEGRYQSSELQIVIAAGMHAEVWSGTLTERDHSVDLVGDGRNVINTGHSAQGKLVWTGKSRLTRQANILHGVQG